MTQATGGDFLDHFTLGDGRVVFALGDVTGHGISAALVTAMAKAAVRLLCPRMPDTPNEVLRRIAQLFFEVLERRLAMTCILGVADPASGQIILANAGQTFPLLLRAGTSPSFVEAPTTFPLGLSKKAAIAQVHLDLVGATVTATQPAAVDIGRGQLAEGRVALVLYTDGLIEAIDESGQQIGFERFKALVQRTIGDGAEPGTAVFAALRAITGRVPWPDDASLLVVEWLAAGRADAPPSPRNDGNPVTEPARSRPTAPCP